MYVLVWYKAISFPAATETVASANGAIMVVAEHRDEVAEPSHQLQQNVGEDEGQDFF